MNVMETNDRGAFAEDGIAYCVADAEGNETYFYAVEENGGWVVESIEVPADEDEDPGNQTQHAVNLPSEEAATEAAKAFATVFSLKEGAMA